MMMMVGMSLLQKMAMAVFVGSHDVLVVAHCVGRDFALEEGQLRGNCDTP